MGKKTYKDTHLSEAMEFLASLPVTVHLFTKSGQDEMEEVEDGVGYKPQTVKGKVVNGKIIYDKALFVFSGPYGRIWGFYVTDRHDELIRAEPFKDVVVVARKGDKIEVNISRE